MSDAGRPINTLTDKVAAQIAETDRLIGHDASSPAAFRATIEELRRVFFRNEDDLPLYAEGAFTPSLTGATTAPTVSYGARGATYVRIGSLVTVGLLLITSARSGGTGAAVITGLPFPVAAIAGGSIAGGLAEIQNIALTGSPVGVSIVPAAASSGFQMAQIVSDGPTTAVQISSWGATGRLRTTFSYFTDFANPL